MNNGSLIDTLKKFVSTYELNDLMTCIFHIPDKHKMANNYGFLKSTVKGILPGGDSSA